MYFRESNLRLIFVQFIFRKNWDNHKNTTDYFLYVHMAAILQKEKLFKNPFQLLFYLKQLSKHLKVYCSDFPLNLIPKLWFGLFTS